MNPHLRVWDHHLRYQIGVVISLAVTRIEDVDSCIGRVGHMLEFMILNEQSAVDLAKAEISRAGSEISIVSPH